MYAQGFEAAPDSAPKQSSPRSIHSLPDELVLQILQIVMTSDAPFDLDSFCKTGQRLQSGRFGEQTKSPESRQILVTPDAVGTNEIVHQKTNGTLSTCPPLVLKDSLPLPQWTFYDNLEDDHKDHYLDWLLTSTCRRWRTMGKAVFFSSKTIILEPSTLASLVHGTATNISQIEPSYSCRPYLLRHRASVLGKELRTDTALLRLTAIASSSTRASPEYEKGSARRITYLERLSCGVFLAFERLRLEDREDLNLLLSRHTPSNQRKLYL